MAQGMDTTDRMVYGHEAWILTDKSRYEAGDTVHAVLRWGHNMRPDGFCRADEFDIFYAGPDGKKVILTPTKGEGDYYDIEFPAPAAGAYTLMAIYENTYGHDGDDNWYEGVRRNLPLSRTVTNYLQMYAVGFSVGQDGGELPFLPEARVAFSFLAWRGAADILTARLHRDGRPEGLVSVTLVFYDGESYQEKMLLTDKNGELFFSAKEKGTYLLIYGTGLDEAVEGEYEERAVTSTFTYISR